MRNLEKEMGVIFNPLNDDSRRGRVTDYHCKADPIKRTKAKNFDIRGLKNIDIQNVLTSDDGVESRFTIGLEVEKNRLHRNAVKEYPLFCGFETDPSCGYEAVTHILPLVAPSMWRTKVFNMFVEAKKIIEDEYSPSDYRCGGHISVGCEGEYNDVELLEKVRSYSGIILAIWRDRIPNYYCGSSRGNVTMAYTLDNDKYSVAKRTTFGVEFRLPTAVQSVKQLMRRYEIFYTLMDCAINQKSHRVFYSALRPILLSMYGRGSEKLVDDVINLGKVMQRYINSGSVNQANCGWLEGWTNPHDRRAGVLRRWYVRGFQGCTPENDNQFQRENERLISQPYGI